MFAAYVSNNQSFDGTELDYYKMVAEAAEILVNEIEELKQVSCNNLHFIQFNVEK